MGLFQEDEFSHTTIDIARAIPLAYWRRGNTVIGGGATIAELRKAEVLETEVNFLSTRGVVSSVLLGVAICQEFLIYLIESNACRKQ